MLVIEPDEAIRELLRFSLHRTEREVATVETGNEAIAAMELEHFPSVLVGSPVVVGAGDATAGFAAGDDERTLPQMAETAGPDVLVAAAHLPGGPAALRVIARPRLIDEVGAIRTPHA